LGQATIKYSILTRHDRANVLTNYSRFALILAKIIYILGITVSVHAGDSSPDKHFMQWKNDFRETAFHQGISYITFDKATKNLAPDSAVIKLDRNQPETTLTLQRYLDRTVREKRVVMAQKLFAEHKNLFNEIREKYGVPPSLLLALWAIETDFGRHLGTFSTIRSLITLAYDQRRSAFFSRELIDALYLVQNNLLQLPDLKSSWAGAMGQFQFLPSVIRQYAVNYDSDGVLKLFEPHPDAFATAANYLVGSGWNAALPWGTEVDLPEETRVATESANGFKPLQYWHSLGISRQLLPAILDPDTPLKMIHPDGDGGRTFLVTINFEAILVWNRSSKFALAVFALSERIESRLIN
jgi:membrane-bound lytic murein transglycosylase B